MPDDDTLRVSDEQRERAAQEIREHFAAGRLTDEELSDRVQAAYAARTQGDLNAVLADLPKLPASPAAAQSGARGAARPPPAPAAPGGRGRRRHDSRSAR